MRTSRLFIALGAIAIALIIAAFLFSLPRTSVSSAAKTTSFLRASILVGSVLGKLNQFNGNVVNAEMVKAFIDSDEYRHRFGS